MDAHAMGFKSPTVITTNELKCACGNIIERTGKRGRPATKCPECRAPRTGRISIKKAAPIEAAPPIKVKSKNGTYNRFELLAYLEENPGRKSAQEVASIIRSLNAE